MIAILQVQKWAPTADKRVNVQMLIGFGAAYVDVQFNGPQTDAEAAVQASGLLNVPGITVNTQVLGFVCFLRSHKSVGRN